MSRTLRIAAIQMDAMPAPTVERLSRAANLVAEAARSGAELVVLPECFGIGYAYVDSNYAAAEPPDGQTVTWMKTQARQLGIYVVGTLPLCDGGEVYNSALLVAPDGHIWRYDKAYPFNWERAYFREGKHITVADTPLGRFGLLICWDAAHPHLWQQYAGKVDAMLIPSCPPRVNAGELVFPDGKRIKNWFRSGHFADGDLQDQAAWLHVPVIHASGSGKFRSPMPAPVVSVMGFLLGRPKEWRRVRDSAAVQLEADYGQHTQIISADGQVIGCVTEPGDSFTLAEVNLAHEMPKPAAPQPKMRTAAIAYFVADVFGPAVLRSVYRRQHRAH